MMDNNKLYNYFKFAFAFIALLILYFFHLTQNLYFVNTLNDFNEYIVRAEAWVNGVFTWGGTGKLLSIIEYLVLKYNDFDFMWFYHTTNNILISIAFLSAAIFIFRKNDFLPSLEVKTFIVIFLYTMPYVVFKNTTIEQSMLFASLLLLFFAVYDIPYLGFLSFIVYISRPEAIILFPTFVVLWYLHKNRRKQILIHFITFVILFVGLKIFEHYSLGNAFSQQQFTQLAHSTENTGYGLMLWYAIKRIPILLLNISIRFPLELLQSYLLLAIFLIGIIFSAKNKKFYIFYTYALFFLAAGLYISIGKDISYKDYFNTFGWLWNQSSFLPDNIFIANGYQPKFDIILHHSRYRLPLYIFVATFVIQGFYHLSYWAAKYATPLFTKKKITEVKLKHKKKTITKKKTEKIEIFSRQQVTYMLLSVFMFFAIAYNINVYTHFKKPYTFAVQWAKTEPVYKLAAEIRKNHDINDKIFIEAYCESSDGQFPTMIATYSGVYDIMLRLCDKASMRVKKHPQGKRRITYEEIKDRGTFGFVIVHSTVIDYKRSFAPTVINNFKNLYQPEALDSIGIRYIISQRNLKEKFPQLELKKTEGNLFLFEHNFKKNE